MTLTQGLCKRSQPEGGLVVAWSSPPLTEKERVRERGVRVRETQKKSRLKEDHGKVRIPY